MIYFYQGLVVLVKWLERHQVWVVLTFLLEVEESQQECLQAALKPLLED